MGMCTLVLGQHINTATDYTCTVRLTEHQTVNSRMLQSDWIQFMLLIRKQFALFQHNMDAYLYMYKANEHRPFTCNIERVQYGDIIAPCAY